MLLADASRYLDREDIQTFDALRHKIETRRREEQAAQAAALARKKPVGDRMRVNSGD